MGTPLSPVQGGAKPGKDVETNEMVGGKNDGRLDCQNGWSCCGRTERVVGLKVNAAMAGCKKGDK